MLQNPINKKASLIFARSFDYSFRIAAHARQMQRLSDGPEDDHELIGVTPEATSWRGPRGDVVTITDADVREPEWLQVDVRRADDGIQDAAQRIAARLGITCEEATTALMVWLEFALYRVIDHADQYVGTIAAERFIVPTPASPHGPESCDGCRELSAITEACELPATSAR